MVDNFIKTNRKVHKAISRNAYLTSDYRGNINGLRDILIKEGVDPDMLTKDNLIKLSNARVADYLGASNTPNYYAYRTTSESNPIFHDYDLMRGKNRVGYIDIADTRNVPNIQDRNGVNISMVRNLTQHSKSTVPLARGVSEQAYNAVIGDLGDHFYRNTNTAVRGPAYDLLSPTYHVPVKYLDMFGLEGIDNNGRFIIDFTKGPMYKHGGQIRKTLNRVYKDGGTLNQNETSYTPFILDNQILQFDDNMGLMSYNIPMISRAKKNFEEPAEQPILTNQPEQLTVVIPEETKEEVPAEKTYNGQHVFKHSKMNLGYMDAFLTEAAKYGIFFRVTSGVRHGAKTKQGKTSYHSLGQAIDITPIPGETYADLKYKIKNSPGLVKWMQDRGYGIFDETTPEVMARTGASGAHWHIGKDRVAIQGLQQIMES